MRHFALLMTALCAAACGANAQDRDALLSRAKAAWDFSAPVPDLRYAGGVSFGVPEEGPGALPGAKAARLADAYFNAGPELNVAGDQITLYLRARDPRGQWSYALVAKRGGHDRINFNLFSVDLGHTPGPDIGFEVHTQQGFVMISFPVSQIDGTAWHDFAGRYDGKRIDLFCDGRRMAGQRWPGGALTQNTEPALIGAETDGPNIVRLFSGDMARAAIWDQALSDAEIATLMGKESLTADSAYVEPYCSPVHYRPAIGRLADTIPFFWKGEYHIFYLRAIEKVPWEHLVSTDLVHWKELPTALVSDGAPDGPDGYHMFTGSVTERDGTFHIFYTGWNPANKAGREFVMHATSPDLVHWTKHPEDGFCGDEKHYQNSDFRDPYVFWNADEQKHWMILCARDAKTGRPVQGVAKSPDLKTWEQAEPLLLEPPLGDGTPECPDVFKIGDTWYLVHSPCAGTTDMRYAADLRGPYRPPESPNIDTPILYAAKRMFDGKRHIISGWIRDLGGERDGGDFQWGGDQSIPREVYAGPNGQLLFKPVPEAVAVFTQTALDRADLAVSEKEAAVLDVPDNYLLECTAQLDTNAAFTLRFRAQDDAESGYRLTVRPGAREAEIAGKTFCFKRPAAFDPAQPVHIRAFVLGSIIECFINDAYAFSCRAYDFRAGRLALSTTGGGAEVGGLMVKTAPVSGLTVQQ